MIVMLLNGGTEDHVGLIPTFLSETDERSAKEQFDANYSHGGGWNKMDKFVFEPEEGTLTYPGDPAYVPRAAMQLRDETILIYDSGWVCVVQPDGSYEVARLD